MCFSAEVSYAAGAILIPAGVVAVNRAFNKDHGYLAVAALPLFFGLQQLTEGLLWSAANQGAAERIQTFSLAYMFFSWLAWPIWVPFAAFFLEPCGRRYLYLIFAILGAIVGAMQFIPYFVHEDWLMVKFLGSAISYEGTVLFDFIMPRELTYLAYLFVILVPLLTSSKRTLNVFGILVLIVLAITFGFFRYAYISVFCFGAALMSVYLVYIVFRSPGHQPRYVSAAS